MNSPAIFVTFMAKMYAWFRPLFFLFSPEKAHDLAVVFLKSLPDRKSGTLFENRAVQIGSLKLPGPVGIAAGFDKKGDLSRGLARLGYGFSEIGTFTPKPQSGNPKPRVFRLKKQEALLNRMGFNNPGIEAGLRNLEKKYSATMPVGISIGKQKETPNENALDDYLYQIERIREFCQKHKNGGPRVAYIAINISSPNTPGLRELQEKKSMTALIRKCRERSPLPLFVKFAPDFPAMPAKNSKKEQASELELSIEAAFGAGADGVIVTNTTNDLSVLGQAADSFPGFTGGISGTPLREKSLLALEAALRARKKFPLAKVISSGGVMTPEEAIRRLEMGADLVQVYTGFIYRGPWLAQEIAQALKQAQSRGV